MKTHTPVRTTSNTYFNGQLEVLPEVPEMDNFDRIIYLLKAGEEIIITDYDRDSARGEFRFGQLIQLNGRGMIPLRANFPICLDEEEMKLIDYEEIK